jgi:UDP-N-acetylmuramoyl-tripeptide--D-alanyl-D-alanine ligase
VTKTIFLKLLKFFSKRIIKKYHPQIVGITGSIGKTSAKEAIALVLALKFKLRKNVKNYNNEIGVPLTIIGIEKPPGRSLTRWLQVFFRAIHLILFKDGEYPELLVLEMGADKPGDIRYLVDIAPCTVGVLTFITHAHTEFFKTLKQIALEKRIIISHLTSNDWAVLNFDNELVMRERPVTKARVLTYGFKAGADIQASDAQLLYDQHSGWPIGINFKVQVQGHNIPLFIPTIAEHLVPAALVALVLAVIYEINLIDAAQSLRQLKTLPGHMRMIPGIKKTLIIDDTYNSSPEAAKSALETLAQCSLKAGAERYAVLGDMLELGPETENAHREVGFKAAELGINYVIAVGEASKHTAEAAKEAGIPEHQVATFADSKAAGKFLQDKLQEGDMVLVKGSQGIRMEYVVKEIMDNPLKAKELLTRQEDEWQDK